MRILSAPGLLVALVALVTQVAPAQAATLTGTVAGLGMGIPNVDIDVLDPNGTSIPLVGDLTDVSGNFSVTVPDNTTYDVLLIPTVASRFVPEMVSNVSVGTGTTSIGLITVVPGALLTGTVVRTAGGTPVVAVDLDLLDSAGDQVFLPQDNSDLSGNFSLIAPLGPVRFRIRPATMDRLVAQEISLNLGSDLSLGTLSLDPGAVLSGRVVRLAGGAAVQDADTDTDISSTGERVFTLGDNTDNLGMFSVIVPFTTVDLSIEPVKADRLVGIEIPNIVIVGDTDLGTISLTAGALLSGRVVRASNGAAVVGADTDVDVSSTGVRVPTAGDDTDALGDFSVVVPLTTVDFTVEPQKADRLVARTVLGIVIAGDTNIGVIALDDGALLTGRVLRTSDGMPVVAADTDLADSFSGEAIVTPADNTDAAGNFSVVAPLGTVQLCIEPAKADRLVAVRLAGVDVTGDANLGDFFLDDGFLVSGTVLGPARGGLPSVSASAFDMATGARVPTPQSESAVNGAYSFVLPAGTFLLRFSAPLGQGTASLFVEPYVVSGDQTLDPVLLSSDASILLGDAGHLVDRGGRYRPRAFVLNNTMATLPVDALIQARVPSFSRIKNIGPPTPVNLPGNGRILRGRVPLRIPSNLDPRFLGKAVHLAVLLLDPTTQATIDESFIQFEIR